MYTTYLAALLWLLMATGLVLAGVLLTMWRRRVIRTRHRRAADADFDQLSW